MPVTAETLRNTRKVTAVFAASSVLMTLTMVWLVLVDHQRPWKNHQAKAMDNEAVLAELQYLTTQQISFQRRLEDAQQNVQKCSRDVDPAHNPTYAELLAELNSAKDQVYGLDLTFKQKDALIVVLRSEYEEALAIHGQNADHTRHAWDKLQAMELSRVEARSAKEGVEDRIALLERQRREAELAFADASRELAALNKEVEDARTRRKQYSSQLYRTGLNVPLMDFAAPDGTPGSYEVKQVVAQDVKTKLNFLEGYRVDRCTTCHTVIDNKNFTKHALVERFERFLPAVLEELARRGDPRSPVLSMPQPPRVFGRSEEQLFGNVALYWSQVSEDDRAKYFDALQAEINRYLAYADLPALNLHQPLQAHPHLDLYLTEDSPHPMKKMGCTVCHEGNGQETDFILAAHTPKNEHQRAQWSDKYYDRNLGVPTMTWHTLEHFWDFPMIPATYSEASCAKCHERVDDLGRFQTQTHGAKLRAGKELFEQLGCINCHLVQRLEGARQVGTDFAHVATKLDEGFMQQWIFAPQDFRPATRMPHFFQQENNGLGSENPWDPDPLLRTRTETMAITHYLRYVSTSWQPEVLPEGLSGDASRGQQLFAAVGCLACHGNIAEYGGRWVADDLAQRLAEQDREHLDREFESRLSETSSQIDRRVQLDLNEDEVEALHRRYAELVEQRRSAPRRSAEDFRSQAEAQTAGMSLNAMTYYAVEHFTEERRQRAELRADEEQLLASIERRDPDALLTYLPPVFTRFAPDLSGIGTKVSLPWMYSWLRNPKHYSSYTKMPSLRLTEQEALDLATYLAMLKHDTFVPSPMVQGPEVVAELDRRVENILSGQNSAATVQRIQQDEARMLTSLLENSLGPVPESMSLTDKKMLFVGRKMIAHYGCFACHAIAGFERAARPGTELSEWGEKNINQLDFAFFSKAYDETLHHSDRFSGLYPHERADLQGWHGLHQNPELEVTHTHASFATHKLLNPRIWDREKLKRPYEKLKMPNYYLTSEEAEALTTYLLSRRPARVADKLKIDYDSAHSGPIAQGRALINELNCVGCHKIEDNYSTMHQFITTAGAAAEEEGWGDDEEAPEESDDAAHAAGEGSEGLPRLGDHYGGAFDVPNGPPWLRGEGAKVQPEWFHGFLLNVETLRPWKELKVRMPSFYLTSEQAAMLVDYFSASTRHEAYDLSQRLERVGQAVDSSTDPHDALKTWYEQPQVREDAQVLRRYAVENELMLERSFEFADKGPEQVQDVYARVLDNARFFAHLYEVPYPFEFSDFQPMDSERFALGSELFQELKCLSCHVLGDPGFPGSNPTPSAPNLNLAHKRLRYEWFHQWLQEPGKIQPNTKMPQWFPGGRSAYAEYSQELRGPFEARYGNTGAEQMKLLQDYVWQAGGMNLTAVAAPGAVSSLSSGATGAPAAQSDPAPEPGARLASGTSVLRAPLTGVVGPGASTAVSAVGKIHGRVMLTSTPPAADHLPVPAKHHALCGAAPRPVGQLQVSDSEAGVAGCVVYLASAIGGQTEPLPTPEPVTIHGCNFSRPVSIVPPGRELSFVNEDAATCNLQARSGDTLIWSKNLSHEDPQAAFSPQQPGILTVRASGMEWMSHHVWVVDHSGCVLTAEDGTFTLLNVPAGSHTLHVWHPGWRIDSSQPKDEVSVAVLPVAVGGSVVVEAGRTSEVIIELVAEP